MRYRLFIPVLCIAMLAGCTGTKISSTQLAQLQSNADDHTKADWPEPHQSNVELWYVGSRLVYDYFDYEYDQPSGDHVAKIFHVKKYANGDSSFEPDKRFYYTTDRSKWVKYDPSVPATRPAFAKKVVEPVAKPATNPSGITLDDLHT